MEVKKGLIYTETHEWILVEKGQASVGISDYAQEALGDIVYVEVPEVGIKVSKGDEVMNIESVKVAEGVYAPASGTVVDINDSLEGQPEKLNEDPYGTFIYVIEMTDPSELDGYMDADAYQAFIESKD
ncbi:MAG: glycine cleavage system protein H [spirochete symbiont of Stewartia floridana]|nr:MAG: glycine cleavage system protein H [spirochete symbiont of Stewartia floridana]